jgi:hypothetical protein
MGASKIAHHVFFRVAPLLVSDNHTALLAEHGKTARHGLVIGKTAITVQFGPILKTPFDVIEREWPLHMPGDLDTLPGTQVAVNLAAGLAELCLNCTDRRVKIDIVLVGMSLQILQTPFQFKDRFFEIERL